MSLFERALSWYRARTSPRPQEVARLRARVHAHTAATRAREQSTDALLHRLAAVDPHRVRRVRQRIRATPRVVRASPNRVAGGALLVAVLVALALGRPPHGALRALAVELDAREVRSEPLTDAVALSYQGGGTVSGTEAAPRIQWDHGTLGVEVTPDRGIALEVDTPEAEVRVVGTVFEVIQDVLGTQVTVRRGHVRVHCRDGSGDVDLLAGGATTCLPMRAGALLGRARALAERGASPDAILRTLEGALALPDGGGPLRDELGALRISTLAGAGREAEAIAAADVFLAAGGGARRGDVARIAGRIAMRTHGCDAALPYADAIPTADRIATDEVARADCLGARDPVAARAALEAALALHPDAALEASLRARLALP